MDFWTVRRFARKGLTFQQVEALVLSNEEKPQPSGHTAWEALRGET